MNLLDTCMAMTLDTELPWNTSIHDHPDLESPAVKIRTT